MIIHYLINNTTKEVVEPAYGYWDINVIDVPAILEYLGWSTDHNIGLYSDKGDIHNITDNFEEVDLYETLYEKKYLCNITATILDTKYSLETMENIKKNTPITQQLFIWYPKFNGDIKPVSYNEQDEEISAEESDDSLPALYSCSELSDDDLPELIPHNELDLPELVLDYETAISYYLKLGYSTAKRIIFLDDIIETMENSVIII